MKKSKCAVCEAARREAYNKRRREQRAAKRRQVAIDELVKRLGAQCLALFEEHKDAVWQSTSGPMRVAGMAMPHLLYALAKVERGEYGRPMRVEALQAELLRRLLNTKGWTNLPWFGKGLDARLASGRG